MDGTAAMFRAVEDAIAGTGDDDRAAATTAWTASWLAAAALRIRIDDSRAAAMSWLRSIPSTERDRAGDLEAELNMVSTSLDLRWQSLVEAMAGAGNRLSTQLAREDGRTDATTDSTAVGPPPAAAVPVAVRASGKVAFRVPATMREPRASADEGVSSPAAVAVAPRPIPRPPARTPLTPSKATRIASPVAAGGTTTPQAPATRTPSRPLPSPALRPAPAQPMEHRGTAMQAADDPTPAAARGGRRRGVVLAALVALAGVLLTGALLAGTIGPLARDSDGISAGGNGASLTPSLTASTRASPSDSAIVASASPSILIAVDLHRIGPLDPDELPIMRVSGAPEVVAFPTAFDRSIRLSGTASWFCAQAAPPTEGGVRSAAFDLHLGQAGSGGSLSVSLGTSADAPPNGLRLDLALLEGLDHEAWYRLTVIATDGRAARIEIAQLGTDGPVNAYELDVDATVPTSPGEVCVHASLDQPASALFIDNLRIDL